MSYASLYVRIRMGSVRSFCLLPTESLVLIVLQILLDAAQSADKPKENNVAPPIFVQKNRVNDNDKSVPSISRGIFFLCLLHCFVIFCCC